MWQRRLRLYLLKFLRLKGAPGKVALGFAAGACVNFLPTFGFGIPAALFVVGLIRGNIPAGILGDVIFKPLFPLFFYFDIIVGGLVLGHPVNDVQLVVTQVALLNKSVIMNIGTTFLVGACINILLLGTLLFFVIYILFRSYRRVIIKLVQERIGA